MRIARVEAVYRPLLRCSRTAKGRVHRVRSGIAERGTDDDKEHKQSPGERRADARDAPWEQQ